MGITHLRRYDLNLMLVLHVILQERSITRAARRLGLTQSAVSRALSRLRDQIGDELIVRTGGGMVPTPRALQMKDGLARMLHELGIMLEPPPDFAPSELQRVFRIITADHPIAVLVPQLISQLVARAPGVKVHIEPPSTDLSNALSAGDLDLVISPRRASWAGIVWSRVFTDRFVTIARKGHPRVRQRLNLKRFTAEGHVLVSPDSGHGPGMVDRRLAEDGLERRVVLRVANFFAAPLVVAESDLLATIPEQIVARHAAGLGLRIFTPPLKLDGLTVAMGWHERFRRDPVHAWFRQQITQAAARDPDAA